MPFYFKYANLKPMDHKAKMMMIINFELGMTVLNMLN